ncbi:hypothetical protein GCM10020331_060450 [Ectobacillus funiculus]
MMKWRFLIDTGIPGQLEQIRLAMSEAGVSFDKLKAVILTHQDLDHIGSLPEILNQSNNNIEVYAHAHDKPYIEGTLPLLKTDPNKMSKEQWAALPEQMKFLYKKSPESKGRSNLGRWSRTFLLWRYPNYLYTRSHTWAY